MDDGKLRLSRPSLLAVPARDAQALLEAGDGDCALLYLHIVKSGGVLDAERAAAEMRLTVRAVRGIAQRLERIGLLAPSDGERETLPSRELPEYRAEDLVRRSRSDPEFQALVEETQSALGRVLSSADLKKLFGIYDELALPADVIMLLVHHCREEHDERYGATRHLGFAVIEKQAYAWFDREIVTYERAEEYLAELRRRKSRTAEIRRAIGIRDRDLVPTERRYIDSWIDMGFGPEALALAADRTVTNTGELKWRYMDSIVRSWHGKGLHTVSEIEQGDRRPAAVSRTASAAPDAKEMERMQRLREKLKNG